MKRCAETLLERLAEAIETPRPSRSENDQLRAAHLDLVDLADDALAAEVARAIGGLAAALPGERAWWIAREEAVARERAARRGRRA